MKGMITLTVGIIVIGMLALWYVLSTNAACEEAGGVMVRNTCIDRSVIVEY